MGLLKRVIVFVSVIALGASICHAGESNRDKFPTIKKSQDYVTLGETIDWTAKALGVSDELIKAFAKKEYKLFSVIGDGLTVSSISIQIAEDKYWAAFINSGKFGLMKLFGKFAPQAASRVNTLTIAIDAYVASLKIIHQYWFIPKLTDKVYRLYAEQREVEDPKRAIELVDMKGGFNYIRPVIADVEKRIREEKYKLSEKDLTPKFRKKIQQEAYDLLESTLERRYYRKVLRPMMQAAGKNAQGQTEKYVRTVAKKLEMPTRGKVIDSETGKPIKFVKVGVEKKRYAIQTRGDGSFYLPVPYELVEGRPFHLYAEKEGYELQYSRVIDWMKETKTPLITFRLQPKSIIHIKVNRIDDPWGKWKVNGTINIYINQDTKKAHLERNYYATRALPGGKQSTLHHADSIECKINSSFKLKGKKIQFNLVNRYVIPKSKGGLLTVNATIDPENGTAKGNYGVYLGYGTCALKWSGTIIAK